MNPAGAVNVAFVFVLIYVKVGCEFVETQHARIETRWGLNEPDCGIVRLPLQSQNTCFRNRSNQIIQHNYRIARGQTAADGEFPWMVSLIWRLWTGVFRYRFCGGAIINKRWILTAAHCLKDKYTSMIRIQVGSHTLSGGDVWYEGERFELHRRYEGKDYDIALIRTKTEIEYVVDEERHMYVVNSICLPQDYVANTDEEFAQLPGFGYLGRDKSDPEFLQKAGGVINDVPPHDYHPTRLIDFNLQRAMTCEGDSGSPLFQYDGRRAVVIGLVSQTFPSNLEEWELFRKGTLICGSRVHAPRVSYYISDFVKELLFRNTP